MMQRTRQGTRQGTRQVGANGAGATLDVERAEGGLRLSPRGPWIIAQIRVVDAALRALRPPARGGRVVIDGTSLDALDTAGAWLLYRTRKALTADGCDVVIEGLRDEHAVLFEEVEQNDKPAESVPHRLPAVVEFLMRIGAGTMAFLIAAYNILGFFGLTLSVFARCIVEPWRVRVTPLTHHLEATGLNAVPIIMLMNFLVGAVIAYQGASQLRMFGAEVFAVDLLSISFLREIGILLTAIMVAGRSGSAFAAEIGAMKVHEEVDAMRTLALDPAEMLVVPRILALVIAVPLLAFLGNIAGLAGGGLVIWSSLGITPGMFVARLVEVTDLTHFWVGMIKAPVFGYLIAMIGCYEGFQVEGSAESVGQRTTQAVVESIFVVIVVDAFFSIFFVEIGW